MNRATLCLILLLLSGCEAAQQTATAAETGKLTLTTERVVIFKDGYGLFVKNASGVADENGRVFTDNVPDRVVLGSFWATSDQHKTLGIAAEWVERKEERSQETACLTTLELLRANKGRKVTLGLLRTPEITGIVADVLELPPENKLPPPASAAPPQPDASWRSVMLPLPPAPSAMDTVRELSPRGGQLAVIDTENGRLILPIAEVRTLTGADLNTKMVRREEVVTKTKRLTFETGKESAGKKVGLHIVYFAEGVRWIPTYRVGGELKDDAELALQAEILNEAENIENAAVDLVVGVPSFRFKGTISPLSLEQTLRNALAAAAPNLMNRSNQFSNAMFTQRAGDFQPQAIQPPANNDPGILSLAPELIASGQQDMFVYSASSLNLKKGGRATVPLWDAKVPARHVYTCALRVAHNNHWRPDDPAAQNVSPLRLARNEVWHQLELDNSTQLPWTTGAAILMQNDLALGQDLLTYTPAKSSARLPVTVAIDLSSAYQEEEVARDLEALLHDGRMWAKITKKATVTLRNSRREKSKTHVSVSLGGRVTTAGDGGTITLNDARNDDWYEWNNNGQINNHSDIHWNLTLEPGETKTLTLEFYYYVP